MLKSSNIPVDEFGKKEAKTLEHLLNEVRSGESTLIVDDSSEIKRILSVLCLDILCEVERGEVFLLSEDRQVFRDGRTRRRNLGSSIGEKLELGENPYEAIARSVQEELGISSVQSVYIVGSKFHESMSESFPGLISCKELIGGVAVIDQADFNPQGYTEVQADKTNYFVWNRLGSKTNN